MFLLSFEKRKKKNELNFQKKEKKKKMKGLCNSFPLISGNISIGVRVLVLFDITLVKC